MEAKYNNIVNEFAEEFMVSPDLLPATKYSLAHNPKYYLLNEATSFEDEMRKLMWSRAKTDRPSPQIIQSATANDTKLAEAMNSMSLVVKTKQPSKNCTTKQLRSSSFWNNQLIVTVQKESNEESWTELWLERNWPSKTAAEKQPRPHQHLKKENPKSAATKITSTNTFQKPRKPIAAQNQSLRFPFSRKTTGRLRQKNNRH